jgi:diguanylate cyclase (GGDEF)-like protein
MGDCVLKEMADLLKNNFRGSDIVVRYGGEEIFVVMPFTKLKAACNKLEMIRDKVENHKFCENKRINVTISVGVAEFAENDSLEELILKADRKVYYAKKHGRNGVVCS